MISKLKSKFCYLKKYLSSNRGELAATLTIISSILIILGIVVGTAVVKNQINTNTVAVQNSATLSQSKLGIFILSNYSAGAQQIVSAGPRVIKVMDPQSNAGLMQAVRDYKQKYPDGVVIMRVYVPQSVQYTIAQNPEESATDFWEHHLQPEVNKLSANDRQLINYLSGPNYNENFMSNLLESDAELSWYNNFWTKLIELIASSGIKPNFGEIYVGGFDAIHIPHLIGALTKLKEVGGIWSYHGYTIQYTTDPAIEKDYSLHYREFYDYLKQNHPDLANIPMVLTEGGVDKGGNAKTDGWQTRGTADQYKAWLEWFDSEIKKDSYIIGVTLFQIGDGGWSSFNLELIASWLAAYLKGLSPTTGPNTTPTPTAPSDAATPTTPTTPTVGTTGSGGILKIQVYVTKDGQRRLWSSQDGQTTVMIAGPTVTGQFSVGMDVPTTSGTCYTDVRFEKGHTQGYPFHCEPGTIYWEGAPRNGIFAPGSYNVRIYSLPTSGPPYLIPSPEIPPAVSISVGPRSQEAQVVLEVVESQTPWTNNPALTGTPSPTSVPPPVGYLNEDYQKVIDLYSQEKISPLKVSAWLSNATRVPGLQTAICYPPNCEFNQ